VHLARTVNLAKAGRMEQRGKVRNSRLPSCPGKKMLATEGDTLKDVMKNEIYRS
jgi:hypothetical protein